MSKQKPAGKAVIGALPRQRRHTLHFLSGLRDFAPVYIDTEVHMHHVIGHRSLIRDDEQRPYSIVTYVLHAAAQVLARHPEANSAIRGRWRPRVARYPAVNGKLAFDKTIGGERVVLTAVIPGVDSASLDEVQDTVDRLRDGDPAEQPEFEGARLLHKLPVVSGRMGSRMAIRPLKRRAAMLGTFSVTSLGHRPVDGFYSCGGTTITLGLGRIVDRPVVRAGQIVVAPVMRLSLGFDHRVIDGAEAADVLAEIRTGLERFLEDPAGANALIMPGSLAATIAAANAGAGPEASGVPVRGVTR